MKTPSTYKKNLENRVITLEMLRDCLFSVNKRAKNCRDKERKYRNNDFEYQDKYREKKEEYYDLKEKLLTLLEPVCIHRELYGYERERIYDYDSSYQQHLRSGDFVWENSYYDSYDEGRTVYFGDIELKNQPKYHYYLFYDLGDSSFHTPIEKESIENYDLGIIDIDCLDTHGYEFTELLSMQFVKKVVEIIETNNYRYVKETENKAIKVAM